MLDHVFTDAISALRDAFEAAFLERQAFEEHFQVDVLLGDITWETSYGLPGEGQPPRVVAHVTFDWPTWSQTAYRRWYVDEELETPPAIEMEIVLRIQRLAEAPDVERVYASLPTTSPLIGDGRLERAGLTVEIGHPDPQRPRRHRAQSYAVEITYEGLYELAEETLADGTWSVLDEHFGALGGWVASTLVRLGDLRFAFLPADDSSGRVAAGRGVDERTHRRARCCSRSSERIATITLNRPEARNALSSEVLAAAPASCSSDAEHDDDVDVIDPHRRRPGVLRRPRPQGARLAGGQPRRRPPDGGVDAATRAGRSRTLTKPLIGADQRRRRHRRVRAGAQLRLPRRLRAGQVRRHPRPRRRDAGLGADGAAPPGDRRAPGPRDELHRQLPRRRGGARARASSTTSSPTTS